MTHNQPSGHRNKAPAKKKSFDAKNLSSEQREKINNELKRRGWKSGGKKIRMKRPAGQGPVTSVKPKKGY